MNILEMAVENLAELLFKEVEKLPYFDFYIARDSFGACQWAYRLEVVKFADSFLVIGNYYGGGSPFCMDITLDDDSSALNSCLKYWLTENECDSEDGEPVVYVDEIGYGNTSR